MLLYELSDNRYGVNGRLVLAVIIVYNFTIKLLHLVLQILLQDSNNGIISGVKPTTRQFHGVRACLRLCNSETRCANINAQNIDYLFSLQHQRT